MSLLFFGVLLLGVVYGLLEFHDQLTTEELVRYFGKDDQNQVPSYELVSPVHLHGNRHRRSPESPKDSLIYKLTAFGKNLTLFLNHNDKLIAPGCKVHDMASEHGGNIQPCASNVEDCYYHGFSVAHNGSIVAVGICGGLHGLIHVPGEGEDLWIQPVASKHVNSARRSTRNPLPHPHIIYKRQAFNITYHTDYVVMVGDTDSESESTKSSKAPTTSGEKYAEMWIVADDTIRQCHKPLVRQYLLVVCNIAASILKHPSIVTPLNFVVSKITLLKKNRGPNIEPDASQTLASFCKWQEERNEVNSSTGRPRYDGAALLTRVDLESSGKNSTAGLAYVGHMCRKNTRCSINEDRGFDVGVLLAHETGHTIGMTHDSEACPNISTDKLPTPYTSGGYEWSSCNQKEYLKFLQDEKTNCLDDVPRIHGIYLKKYSNDLPHGQLYSGDEQCEMAFAEGYTHCPKCAEIGEECLKLWCNEPTGDKTWWSSNDVLNGTMCSEENAEVREFCVNWKCVRIGPNGPRPKPGNWSKWGRWSKCTHSCGGGVKIKTRNCTNPRPLYGGKCEGRRVKAAMCNMKKECDSNETDFRSAQCTEQFGKDGFTTHSPDLKGCEFKCQKVEGRKTSTTWLKKQGGEVAAFKDGSNCTARPKSAHGRCVREKCVAFDKNGKEVDTTKS